MKRFPWVLTLLAAILLAVLVALGVWQVQRMAWKEGLIAASIAAEHQPPAPLDQVLADPAPEFRRALVVCRGLATAPYVELQSIHDGAAGVRLVSVCRPEGLGQTFLVDRGFVADTVSARPPVRADDAMPLAVLVVLRRVEAPGAMSPPPSNGRFFARDPQAMAAALKADGPVADWTLFAVTSSNPDWQALTPSAPPAAFSNNHLGYALTWFGLALALVVFYGVLLRRRLRTEPSA